MRSRLQRSGPLAIMLLTLAALVYARFEKLFACPSCYLFSNGSDGLKNYFTSAFFVHHDPGAWFGGMNYPYGEHIVYTDNQPLWSLLMKAVDRIFPMQDHVIGTTNMLLVVSILFCGLIVYYILRELHLPRWYAALMAIPITLLSPQLERFNGHFSLAYIFYLPLLILLTLRVCAVPSSWSRAIWLVVAITAMGFTHLYFLFLGAILLVTIMALHLIFRSLKPDRTTLKLLGITILAGALVYGTVTLTDPVTDRPDEVYGVYVYTAKAQGTFLPWYEPFASLWLDAGIRKPDVEGISYIGWVNTVLFLLIAFLSVRTLLKRRRRIRQRPVVRHPAFWTIVATLIWLIATGWIYQIGAGVLLDAFPVLGQFRSLGRLGWLFYSTLSICMAYWGYILLRTARRPKLAVLIFGLCLSVWTGEALGHFWDSTKAVFKANLVFRHTTPYLDFLEQQGKDSAYYQAILQFPSLLIGPEKVGIDRGVWYMPQSMQCAWETGLPMITSMMSRTSVSQAMDFIELTSEKAKSKRRLQQMTSQPLLLLVGEAYLGGYEQRIIKQCEPLGIVNFMKIYELPVSVLKNLSEAVDTSVVTLVAESFDDKPAARSHSGPGARLIDTANTLLYEFTESTSSAGNYVMSCWVLIDAHAPGVPAMRHQAFNREDQLFYNQQHSRFTFPMENADGQWLELAIPFAAKGAGVKHRFIMETKDVVIDDLRLEQSL